MAATILLANTNSGAMKITRRVITIACDGSVAAGFSQIVSIPKAYTMKPMMPAMSFQKGNTNAGAGAAASAAAFFFVANARKFRPTTQTSVRAIQIEKVN